MIKKFPGAERINPLKLLIDRGLLPGNGRLLIVFGALDSLFQVRKLAGAVMATKQKRRSVSMSGDAYSALKAFAEENDTSQSAIVEDLVRKLVGMEPRDAIRPTNGHKVETIRTSVTISARPTIPANDHGTRSRDDGEWKSKYQREAEARAAEMQKKAEAAKDNPDLTKALREAGNIFTF